MGDTLVLAISGELDLATRDLLRDALAQIDDEPPPRLVVDLRGLVFIDVSGLSLLQSLATRCRTRGQVLELIPGPAPVHEAFAITGLADRLPFTGSCTQRRVAEYPQPDPASSPFADPLLALLL